MDDPKLCQGCKSGPNCEKVYRQAGAAGGPSVVFKVIVAFLLPLVVFIVSLAVFENFLSRVIDTNQLQAVLNFLLALSVTFIFVIGCSLLTAHGDSK